MMERPTFHDDDDDVDDDDYNAKYKYTQTRQRVIMRLMPSGSLITTFQFHPLLSSLWDVQCSFPWNVLLNVAILKTLLHLTFHFYFIRVHVDPQLSEGATRSSAHKRGGDGQLRSRIMKIVKTVAAVLLFLNKVYPLEQQWIWCAVQCYSSTSIDIYCSWWWAKWA